MAQIETTEQRGAKSVSLRKAAMVTAAASKAVAQIQDPKRRAEAQALLDNMRQSEANLQKGQGQRNGLDRSVNRPELKKSVIRRDQGQDYDR